MKDLLNVFCLTTKRCFFQLYFCVCVFKLLFSFHFIGNKKSFEETSKKCFTCTLCLCRFFNILLHDDCSQLINYLSIGRTNVRTGIIVDFGSICPFFFLLRMYHWNVNGTIRHDWDSHYALMCSTFNLSPSFFLLFFLLQDT